MTAEALQGPLIRTKESNVEPVAAAADLLTELLVASFDANVTACTYTTPTALTGANTETRTVNLKNATASVTAATLAFASGVNTVAHTPKAITVSGTAANVLVTAGDVLYWQSLHSGSTGLADPGGLVRVELTRR